MKKAVNFRQVTTFKVASRFRQIETGAMAELNEKSPEINQVENQIIFITQWATVLILIEWTPDQKLNNFRACFF